MAMIVLICYPQASNNQISSLPEDMANCSKLSKLDVEVLVSISSLSLKWLLSISFFLFHYLPSAVWPAWKKAIVFKAMFG